MDEEGAAEPGSEQPRTVPEAYRRYGPALLRKAERILGNPDDAGDIVQGIFAELLARSAPAGLEPRQLELPYLYRAVTNRCLNLLRDSRNRQRLLERQEPALRGPIRIGCDDQLLGLDLLVKLSARLDRKGLEILICRFWDDMTQEEIATALGLSRRTVGKRLARIRSEVADLCQARKT